MLNIGGIGTASLGEEGRGLCHLLALAGDGGTAALISGRQIVTSLTRYL